MGFTPPESGNAPQGVKDILTKVYSSCRQRWVDKHQSDRENPFNKESCARIAWSAVKGAGWKDVSGTWKKTK